MTVSARAIEQDDAPFVQPRQKFLSELDALLKDGISRPYGLAWSDTPQPTFQSPQAARTAPAAIANFESGATPAVGLLLQLASELFDEPRYRDAAKATARAIGFSMEPTGRVPAFAGMLPGQLGAREPHGQSPRRSPTTASLGFLLILDKSLSIADPAATQPGSPDARISSIAVRGTTWIVKQQLKTGAFPVEIVVPGDTYPRRISRLDIPETRDSLFTFLLIQQVALGRDTSFPVAIARNNAARGITQLCKYAIDGMGRTSRHLWPSAYELDGNLFTALPELLPAAGNMLSTRLALQTLIAYHVATGDAVVLETLKPGYDAVLARKGPDETWTLIDDPANRFLPPGPASQPVERPGSFTKSVAPGWAHGTFGLPQVLSTIDDVRTLGRESFLKLTARTLPPELAYAAILTGLTDTLPAADFPLSKKQVPAYIHQHPETFDCLRAPASPNLTERVRRLWALYLLAKWETQFDPAHPRTGQAAP